MTSPVSYFPNSANGASFKGADCCKCVDRRGKSKYSGPIKTLLFAMAVAVVAGLMRP